MANILFVCVGEKVFTRDNLVCVDKGDEIYEINPKNIETMEILLGNRSVYENILTYENQIIEI